jgi:Flp pilus assembly protein TadG
MNRAVKIISESHVCASDPTKAHSESGQSIVELTLLLPLLFVIFLAGADLARLFYHGSALAQAARAGVQYGAQNLGTAANSNGMRDAAINSATDLGLTTANIFPAPSQSFQCASDPPTSTQTVCSDGRAPKVFVNVTVSKNFQTMFNYPGIPHNVAVSREATMRVQ